MNKMLPCPCCGRAVFGEWKSKDDLGMGWIKGEYEITAKDEVLNETRIVILVPNRTEAQNVNRDGAVAFVANMVRTLAADRNTVVAEPKSERADWLRRTLCVVRNVVTVIETMGDYHMTDKDRHVIAQVKDVTEFYRVARELRGLDHRVTIAFTDKTVAKE